MQIVINIPESYYEGVILDRILESTLDGILEAIKNGKVLPKGHGRLIDADALKYSFELSDFYGDPNDCVDAANYIVNSAPTIIEANEE